MQSKNECKPKRCIVLALFILCLQDKALPNKILKNQPPNVTLTSRFGFLKIYVSFGTPIQNRKEKVLVCENCSAHDHLIYMLASSLNNVPKGG